MKNNYIITLRTPLNRISIDYQGQPIIQENEHYREWLLRQDLTEEEAKEWLAEKASELSMHAAELDMIDKGEDYLSYDNKTWKIRTLKEALDMGMMGNMRRNLLRQLRQLLAETLEVEVEEIEYELLTRSHVDDNYHTIYATEDGELDYHEEVDAQTSQYYDYPDRPVACVYQWGNGSIPCNCDTCVQYRHFCEMDASEFAEEYGEDMLIYWEETPLRRALLDEDVELDAVDEMTDAITTIDWGYFVDEQI